MRKVTYILLLMLTLATFCGGTAQAASDDSSADDWFSSDSDSYSKDPEGWLRKHHNRAYPGSAAAKAQEAQAEAAKKAKEQEKEEAEKRKKDRYQVIYQDDNFTYWMDTQNARWLPLPYSKSEQIIDVWVRMMDKSGDYSYPQKYYMEHYYIWPKRRQIQFLCELEVTGQPQNAIKEREYDGRNWENLVPGSVEDNIYVGVLKYMKGRDKKEFFKHLPSFSDVMDSWFNIGI